MVCPGSPPLCVFPAACVLLLKTLLLESTTNVVDAQRAIGSLKTSLIPDPEKLRMKPLE